MKSIEDAQALSQLERDTFYVTAFMIEAWLGSASLEAAAEYAEKKNAKDRPMQTGQAYRLFSSVFGPVNDDDLLHVLQCLHRFAEYDDPQARILLRSIIPLSFEHESYGDYIGPKIMDITKDSAQANSLIRRCIERWCDWIDALVHFQTHALWHSQPATFDPDPEKRELAILGLRQRQFATLNDFGKSWWHWHHAEAAERFKNSPKWSAVGKAMASQTDRLWRYPDADSAIISLWPLLKLHNWTYRDLLSVLHTVLLLPHRYPLSCEQELAPYCLNVLGLRKAGLKNRSNPSGQPPGWQIAIKLFPPTNQ